MIKEQTVFIRGLSIDWNEVGSDSYLRGIEAINELDYLPFRQPITFFVGENGSGKSTLLEAIAIAYGFNPEGVNKAVILFSIDAEAFWDYYVELLSE